MNALLGALFGAIVFTGLALGALIVIFGGTYACYKLTQRIVRKYGLSESLEDLIALTIPLIITVALIGAVIGAGTWQ